MFKLFKYLVLTIASSGFAATGPLAEMEDQEIRVQLNTQEQLAPLYLGKLEGDQNSFDKAYIRDLEVILQYDLTYNGSTKLIPIHYQKEELLNQKEQKEAYNPKQWKGWGIAYVVKPSVANKTFNAEVFSVQTGSLKFFKEIPLVGNLKDDRRQIHKLADAIHKALFTIDGVANSRILYSLQVKNSKQDSASESISEIWECDWDGENARQVTHEESYCITPFLIPAAANGASDRFLYVSYKNGQPKIFIASVKDGVGKKFIDLRGNQLLPAVSDQRDKIAFISDAGGRADLFVQAFNPSLGEVGKPVQLFSFPRAAHASPTFSPDGSKIAFVSDKDGSPRIYIIPSSQGAKRANPALITKQNRESSCPAWSPDGTKLAYSAKTNGVRQIWIYDFDSKEERQLTFGPGNKENPVWANNGMHLVFNSTDPSSSELYVINLNQPEAIKITRGHGKKHYPTWGVR